MKRYVKAPRWMPVEVAGLLAAATTLLYGWAAGVGDGVPPELFAVIAFGLALSLLGLVTSGLALTTGRFAIASRLLGVGCALMLLLAAVGLSAGV